MENLKNKIAIVYDNGLFAELAEKLANDFGKVYYYLPWQESYPKFHKAYVGTGLKNVERIRNFWDYVDQADIIIFPDIYSGDLSEYLKRQGKLVFGSGKAEEIELWRWSAKEKFKELGIDTIPAIRAKGVTELRKILKSTENKFVKVSCYRAMMETFFHQKYFLTEPQLDELEKELGPFKEEFYFIIEDEMPAIEMGAEVFICDGKYPPVVCAGYEIKDKSYIGRFYKYDELPQKLKVVNDKLVPYLKEVGMRGMYSTEVRINEKGNYLTDPCFSEDTEVLTDKGWKFFYELDGTEKICTLNTTSREIEYSYYTDLIKNRYKGKMINISCKQKIIECLVTPNHGIWRTWREKNGKLYVERADSLKGRGFIPRTGKWKGNDTNYFILPEYKNEWDFTCTKNKKKWVVSKKIKHENQVKIKMSHWIAFMGWYISEGSLGGKWSINITQRKYKESLRNVLKKLPFNFSENKEGFVICSVQLASYLKQFGLCYKKFVPDYIKNLSPKLIKIFLDNFRLGDGGVNKGQNLYYTTSKILADDIQELILKCGKVASISISSKAGTKLQIRDKEYIRKHDGYIISERAKETDFWFETNCRKDKYISEQEYNGYVYDVTVPNHTLYVRRKGKPFWSSNCMRGGVPPGEVMFETISNWGEIVWEIANGRCSEVKYKGKYMVEVMIESAFARDNWMPIYIPDEIKPFVKVQYPVKFEDYWYVTPMGYQSTKVGAIVAYDDNLDKAIEKVKEYAKHVEGFNIGYDAESLNEAANIIKEGEKYGINF